MARKLQSIVDEQVARWHAQRTKQQGQGSQTYVPPNVITLSDALGSDGLDVAHRVGEILDVPVYGRAIVEHIATTERLRVKTVESLDQRAVSRLEDYLVSLIRERNFDQSDYVRALTRTITALWGHGSCVLIGRGGSNIVSHRYALAVRVTAPRDHRIRRTAQLEQLDLASAQRFLSRIDAERHAFIQRHFGLDIDDATQYDLVLNTAGMSVDRAAEIIAMAFAAKFATAASKAA